MKRKRIVAGNWKMNTNVQEGNQLAKEIIAEKWNEEVELILIPPFTHLSKLSEILKSTSIKLGAQNLSQHDSGAYTGEVSGAMLQSIGLNYVLVGHSERREYFKEGNAELSEKLNQALKNDLIPVFCFGEELNDRKSNKQEEVVSHQLQALWSLGIADLEKVVLAYEPVWAIGTGETASAAQAQEMHAFIRKEVADHANSEIAENISILYGGSVKPNNAEELFAQNDIDGGLIGGAALNSADFISIANSF